MAEGWLIAAIEIHRNGSGIVWYTAEGREQTREDFTRVSSEEYDRIKELFPPTRRM